jgi:hypothetical protein
MSDAKTVGLWNRPVLEDAFSDIKDAGGSIDFDNQVLTIKAPKFHIVAHRDLDKARITLVSDSDVFDGAAIDMVHFFRGIDVIAAKILTEIDGIDRGV